MAPLNREPLHILHIWKFCTSPASGLFATSLLQGQKRSDIQSEEQQLVWLKQVRSQIKASKHVNKHTHECLAIYNALRFCIKFRRHVFAAPDLSTDTEKSDHGTLATNSFAIKVGHLASLLHNGYVKSNDPVVQCTTKEETSEHNSEKANLFIQPLW